jgi:hypothetical protein
LLFQILNVCRYAPSPPPPPPTPEPTRNGIAQSVAPRCALADGNTSVDVTAVDAPTGNLTCRFVDYSVAKGLYDAAQLLNQTLEAYEAASLAALTQAINVGFIPEEAALNNYTAYLNWQYAVSNQTATKAQALVFTTFVPPVDAVVVKVETDALNRTLRTARCNVPEGIGQLLTVGLIDDGGAEGVEFLGLHYPLSASNVTELSSDVRLRRMAGPPCSC